jgi:hypothetical protein
MKEYYCKAIRGNGEECGETKELEFYEGRKSICKYCEYKKKMKNEKENKDKENRDEKLYNLMKKLCTDTDERLAEYDKAYNTMEKKYIELNNEIEKLQKTTNELKSVNKKLVEINDIYKEEISKLQYKSRDFIKKDEINIIKERLQECEYRCGLGKYG